MNRFFKVLFTFSIGLVLAAGCAKEYDDTELKGKVDALSAEVNTLKAQQQAMQAVIDVWKQGGYIRSVDTSVAGQYTITFVIKDKEQTVVIYEKGEKGDKGDKGDKGEKGDQGEPGTGGDSYFKDVVPGTDGVTFTLQDDTSFTIPFAKAFKLVIENPSAEVEAGTPVEFKYEVKNANASTTVDVFAGNNYTAVVNEADSKIVVTPPDPAVAGSVLAWAQNEEGLMSMRKLSFIVKADVEIKTDVQEYQGIPADAGEFEVSIVSNVEVDVVQPEVDWVAAKMTKANYKLVLTLQENTTGEPREANIKIVRKDNQAQVQEIKIIQIATKAEPTPFDNNVTWTLGEKAYDTSLDTYLGSLDVTYNETTYKNVKHLKLGTASAAGDATLKLPKGTKYVSFWGVAWNDKDCDIKVEALGKTFTVKKHDGVKGASSNTQPYTMTPTVTDEDKFEIVLDAALEADAEVKIQTSPNPGYRLVLFGIQASNTAPTPKMKMSDVQALCKTSSDTPFVGDFKGLYVNYILNKEHIYLEDESGALRYYCKGGNSWKVGDKISGVISGLCKLDSGRPTINYIDASKAKVEAAPAEEQPKPVTGTLGSFTDVQGLMYRRVTLEDVVLGANIVSGKSSQIVTISDATGSIPLHLRFDPGQTIPKGYKVSGTGTFDVNGGKLEIRIFAKSEVTKVEAPVLTVERLWGKYPNTGWPTDYVGANLDRTVATDGEWVYVAKASSSDYGIVAIKADDPTTKKNVNVEGVDGGLFKTACVRTIYDATNKKYILLASSLTTEADHLLKIYAWKDGVDAAPTTLLSWAVGGYRRFGDFFTVTGTWEDGELWFRNNTDNTEHRCDLCARFTLKNGALTAQWPDAFSLGYNGSKGMGSLYFYEKGKADVLLVTDAIGMFFDVNNGPGGKEWSNGTDVSAWSKRFGYTPFTFNGQKFIAYLHMYNAARGWLTILKDTQGTSAGFMQTLIDNDIFYQAAVQIDKEEASTDVVSGATYSANTMANCSVAVMEDHIIIVGHQQNTGLSVFKMYMK